MRCLCFGHWRGEGTGGGIVCSRCLCVIHGRKTERHSVICNVLGVILLYTIGNWTRCKAILQSLSAIAAMCLPAAAVLATHGDTASAGVAVVGQACTSLNVETHHGHTSSSPDLGDELLLLEHSSSPFSSHVITSPRQSTSVMSCCCCWSDRSVALVLTRITSPTYYS